MNYFEPGDWAVISLYLLGIVALGLRFGKDQHTTRDYFLGSRNIPWWGVGLSIVASETSALTIIGVPAMAYGGDLSFIQIIIGYVLARIILAAVLVPHYFKGEIYSPYQLFADTFGAPARRMAGGFFLISEGLAAGVRVYVACIPIQLMLGIQILPAIVLFVGLSLVYTYVGGIKAVIWTDVVQFLLFAAGGVFTVCYIPQLFEGGFAEAFGRAAAAGKLHWLNPHFSWALPFNLWMGLIGATVQVMSSHGAEQLIVQRVLTCKNVAAGRKALILSAAIILPLFLVFLLTGAMLWVYYQKYALAIPIPEIRPGIAHNDFIFPIFILTAVPSPVKGFLIVAILSAAMSSVSSALSALASVSTMDFFKALAGPERSEEFYLRISKYSTVAWALGLMVVGYLSREVEFVLNAAFSLRGLTSGGLLGGLLLAIWMKRGRAAPVVTGMACSLAVMTVVTLKWKATIAWPWYTLIGTLVTIGVACGMRALLKAPPTGLSAASAK
ncbi:MAG: sodium:solute symporter family transporter [Limisphaerales bacterium]